MASTATLGLSVSSSSQLINDQYWELVQNYAGVYGLITLHGDRQPPPRLIPEKEMEMDAPIPYGEKISENKQSSRGRHPLLPAAWGS